MMHNLRSSVAAFYRGVRMLFVVNPQHFIVYVIVAVISGVLPIVQTWLLKLIVDQVSVQASFQHISLWWMVGGYVGTFMVLYGMEPLESILIAFMQNQATAEVDRRLMSTGSKLVDLGMVESSVFKDWVQILQSTVYQVSWLLRMLRNGCVAVIVLSGVFVLLGTLQPWIAFVVCMGCIPHIYYEIKGAEEVHTTMTEHSREAREIEYMVKLVTQVEAAKEVRMFQLGNFFLERFRKKSKVALHEIERVRWTHMRKKIVASGVYLLALGSVGWYILTQVQIGRLTGGDIALYLSIVFQLQQWLYIVALFVGQFYAISMGMKELFAFQTDARAQIELAVPGQEYRNEQADIECKGVEFRYPESEKKALHDITASLRLGKVTALVGANGAGKSTWVKLLTRMYDPTTGVIELNGQSIERYELSGLRQNIATAHQNFARFALTLRENIQVGVEALDRVPMSVEQAAELAGMQELVGKLPDGYDTQLTKSFEGGVELSGGEWQKVALARCFVRDAQIVILDEPTAALDAEAEERLIRQFRQLVVGKIGLIISHRFSSVRLADQILVMEKGNIIEAGTHGELVEKQGYYAKWYGMQQTYYV